MHPASWKVYERALADLLQVLSSKCWLPANELIIKEAVPEHLIDFQKFLQSTI